MEQNDLKETISATNSHLWFFYSNYYERTSELTKMLFFYQEKWSLKFCLPERK